MKWSHIDLAVSAATTRYLSSPFPVGSENPVVALMALKVPVLLWLMHGGYAAMPGIVVFIGGTFGLGVWRVWFKPAPRRKQGKGGLLQWPIYEMDKRLDFVVGETHHSVEAREISNPDGHVIPERSGFGPCLVVGQVVPVQVDLASDEIRAVRRNELA